MRAVKIFARIISILLIAVLALFLAFNTAFAAARKSTDEDMPVLFGFSTAVVSSGSMESYLSVYDMIITRAADEYAVGDVISFRTKNSVTTHRIIEVLPEVEGEAQFRTRGDANNTEDTDPVSEGQIIGKVVLVIPFIGAVADFIRTPLGSLCALLLGAVILFAPSLWERLKGAPESEAQEQDLETK